MILKPGGGKRPLGIPTIRHRVVQTTAKLVLEPIFEADLDPAAYGSEPDAARRSGWDWPDNQDDGQGWCRNAGRA